MGDGELALCNCKRTHAGQMLGEKLVAAVCLAEQRLDCTGCSWCSGAAR